MNAIVNVTGAAPITMTSLEIVDYVNEERRAVADAGGKKYVELQHKHFLVKVVTVLGEEAAAKFLATTFYEVNSAKREREIYNLPKREAMLLAMSYSYALQAKVYDYMTALEEEVKKTFIPQTLAEALRLAADQAEAVEKLALEVAKKDEQITIAAPKVAFVEKYVEADGALGVQAISRLLKLNMRELCHWLVDSGMCFRKKPSNTLHPYAASIDQGLFVVKTGYNTSAYGDVMYEQLRATPKGITFISENAPEYVRKNYN